MAAYSSKENDVGQETSKGASANTSSEGSRTGRVPPAYPSPKTEVPAA